MILSREQDSNKCLSRKWRSNSQKKFPRLMSLSSNFLSLLIFFIFKTHRHKGKIKKMIFLKKVSR
jgi:hypothetical protein